MLTNYSTLPNVIVADTIAKTLAMYEKLDWIKDARKQMLVFDKAHDFDYLRKFHDKLSQFHNPAIDAFRSRAAISQFALPTPAIAAVNSIVADQLRFTSLFEGVQSAVRANPIFSQIRDLQVALGTVTGNIAQNLAVRKDWQSLDTFSDLVANVAEWSEQKSEQTEALTKADLEEFKEFILLLYANIEKVIGGVGKVTFAKLANYLGIVGFFITAIAFVQSNLPKQDSVTVHDFWQLKKDIHQQMITQLSDTKLHKTILRYCPVYIKPRTNFSTSAHLFSGADVVVLNHKHKWVYISFIDPKDGLAQTGWVMNKYLSLQK